MRQGHIWGDDFALYIGHARNIVEHRPYAETRFLWDSASQVSPKMYPPVFPLLLAPVYRFFGLNLIAMKIEQVLFFVVALAIIYRLWRRELQMPYRLALIAIIGFSPHFWAAKDNVLSDIPFFLFFFTSAVLVEFAPRESEKWWSWAVLVGLALYFSTGTRTAGIALIAGLVLYDLIKYRTLTRLTAVALAVWTSLLMLQTRIVGSGFASYQGQFRPNVDSIKQNLVAYPRALAGFWVASTHGWFSFLVLAVVGILGLTGFLVRCTRGITSVEAFLIPYAALVLLWPFSPGVRLAFPFIPWLAFLVLCGLSALTERFAPRYSTIAVCVLLLTLSVAFLRAYQNTDFGKIRQSTGLPEFNELCGEVRKQTRQQDVLVYYRARALALYTDRSVTSYDLHAADEELWQYSQRVHASYLITSNLPEVDRGRSEKVVAKRSSALELAYQNANFKLYRILPTAETVASYARR